MKNSHRKIRIVVILIIAILVVIIGVTQIDRALGRAALADAISNSRQVKFALDVFASDFDGRFPNADIGERLQPDMSSGFSNDCFRQLFLSGETQAEQIFWVPRSRLATHEPPGKPWNSPAGDPLKPGSVHWAYVTNQRNANDLSRPLLLDPFRPGTNRFHAEQWNGKAIVVTIDGSVKAIHLDPMTGRIVKADGKDFLSSKADIWRGYPGDPSDLLLQPSP